MAMKMISANVMQRENGKRANKNPMNANASGWTRMQLKQHLLAKGNKGGNTVNSGMAHNP